MQKIYINGYSIIEWIIMKQKYKKKMKLKMLNQVRSTMETWLTFFGQIQKIHFLIDNTLNLSS